MILAIVSGMNTRNVYIEKSSTTIETEYKITAKIVSKGKKRLNKS